MKHVFQAEEAGILVEPGCSICNIVYILNYIERDNYAEANNQNLEISKIILSLWSQSIHFRAVMVLIYTITGRHWRWGEKRS